MYFTIDWDMKDAAGSRVGFVTLSSDGRNMSLELRIQLQNVNTAALAVITLECPQRLVERCRVRERHTKRPLFIVLPPSGCHVVRLRHQGRIATWDVVAVYVITEMCAAAGGVDPARKGLDFSALRAG